jgi:hypothetical protein
VVNEVMNGILVMKTPLCFFVPIFSDLFADFLFVSSQPRRYPGM